MMIKIKLKKSNFSKSKELLEVFSTVCKNLCNKKKEIKNTLKDIEPKNES